MSHNKNDKPSSPDEIEFGDATLIGIAQLDKTQVGVSTSPVTPPAQTAQQPAAAPAAKQALPPTQSGGQSLPPAIERIAEKKTAAPAEKKVSAPADNLFDMQDEATVVGGQMPAAKVTPPPTARASAAPATKPAVKIDAPPEVKAEPKVEMKPAPRVEAKAEHRVEAKAEHRVEAKAEHKVETKVEPRVEAKAEPRVVGINDSKSLAGVDMDRTLVEKVNPLKEAFDARTTVGTSGSATQLKRFNPEETQISPPPQVERKQPAPVPAAPSAAKVVKAESKSEIPPEKVRNNLPSTEVVASPNTVVPVSNRKNPEPRKTLLDDAPEAKTKSGHDQTSTRPDTFSPFHERSHASASAHEIVDVEEVDENAGNDVPHKRKTSVIANWMQKIRSRHGSKTEAQNMHSDPHALEPQDAELVGEPKNNRMRNAVIAGGAAVIALVVIMNFSRSGEETPSAAPSHAAHANAVHADSASSETGEAAAAAANSNSADHGQVGGHAQGGGNVAAFIQQFDRSFAKTQDQR